MGTNLRFLITNSFTTMATVVYTNAAMGMGVIFETLSYEQMLILERWLGNLGREPQPLPHAPAKHEAVSFPSDLLLQGQLSSGPPRF